MTRRVPDAAELGLMVGSPPPDPALVTLANWQDPPYNRWGFQHVAGPDPDREDPARRRGRLAAPARRTRSARGARADRAARTTLRPPARGHVHRRVPRPAPRARPHRGVPQRDDARHDAPVHVGVEVDHLDRGRRAGRARPALALRPGHAAHPRARRDVLRRLHRPPPARHARGHALQRGLRRPARRRARLRADLPVAAADVAPAAARDDRLLRDAAEPGTARRSVRLPVRS